MRAAARHLRLRDERGFTLTELLTVMAVLSVLFAVFAGVFSSTIRQSDEIEDESALLTEVRAAVDRLIEDLRQATTANVNAPVAIEAMSSTSLTFLSPDRSQPFRLRRISYRLNGTVFERQLATSTDTDDPATDADTWTWPAAGPWQRLFDSVKPGTAVFTYEKDDGTTATALADVRTVNVSVVIVPPSSGGKELTYQSSATLRAGEAN